MWRTKRDFISARRRHRTPERFPRWPQSLAHFRSHLFEERRIGSLRLGFIGADRRRHQATTGQKTLREIGQHHAPGLTERVRPSKHADRFSVTISGEEGLAETPEEVSRCGTILRPLDPESDHLLGPVEPIEMPVRRSEQPEGARQGAAYTRRQLSPFRSPEEERKRPRPGPEERHDAIPVSLFARTLGVGNDEEVDGEGLARPKTLDLSLHLIADLAPKILERQLQLRAVDDETQRRRIIAAPAELEQMQPEQRGQEQRAKSDERLHRFWRRRPPEIPGLHFVVREEGRGESAAEIGERQPMFGDPFPHLEVDEAPLGAASVHGDGFDSHPGHEGEGHETLAHELREMVETGRAFGQSLEPSVGSNRFEGYRPSLAHRPAMVSGRRAPVKHALRTGAIASGPPVRHGRAVPAGPLRIVVPCFNEARRLPSDAFVACVDRRPEISFLFVDDGSRDATREVLNALAGRRPDRMDVLALDRNQGKAEAVRRGLLHACSASPAYVGYWDADLATSLDEIPRFAAVLDANPELRIVLGSRIRMLGRRIDRKNYRHVYGRAFATAVSTLLSLPVYDTQCGAKLLRTSPELSAILAEPFLTRWVFDVEILARLIERWEEQGIEAAERLYELPLERWVDVAGSKIGPGDAAMAALDLARIGARHRETLWARRKRLNGGA